MHQTTSTLEETVQQFLLQELKLERTSGILVAVSGGKDSMCLLFALHQLNFEVQVAHVNFQLRAEEANKDAALVKAYCQKLGLPYHEYLVDTTAKAKQLGKSIQETARELRYDWFEKIRVANHLDWIATAHHLQDSLETFFINLSRSAGLKGLLGIPEKRGQIIRPFSKITPQEIQAYQLANDIPFREDLSNLKTDYTRNKIRLELLPKYFELPGNPLQAFLQNQKILKQYFNFASAELEKQKKKFIEFKNEQQIVQLEELSENKNGELLLFEILSAYDFNNAQIKNITKARDGALFISSSHEACLKNKKLFVQQKINEEDQANFNINELEGEFHLAEGTLSWETIPRTKAFEFKADTSYAYLSIDKLKFPLQLRRWAVGDRFQPFGMEGKSKLLSDFFADHKYTAFQKREAWLLCSNNEICWLVGQRSSEAHKVQSADQQLLTLKWEPTS